MEWFKDWFDTPYYHLLYNNRDFTEAENFISSLTKDLELVKGEKIIDLACGKGRHSVFLHHLGYDVLGLDLSKQSIEHNNLFAKQLKSPPNISFQVHDMREAIYPNLIEQKVDAIFSLFTSFGYFEDPKDDAKVLKAASEAIKKDGVFVLDFLNRDYVISHLIPETTIMREDIEFKIRKKIENNTVYKDINFFVNNREHHYREHVLLYTNEEIKNMASNNGLKHIKTYGDYLLSPYKKESSPRNILVFKKI